MLAVAFAILAIYIFRLTSWARVPTILLIAVGALFAGIGILASLPHPDYMILSWQLFVIAVDAWILRCLTTARVKKAFTAQHHRASHVEAHS